MTLLPGPPRIPACDPEAVWARRDGRLLPRGGAVGGGGCPGRDCPSSETAPACDAARSPARPGAEHDLNPGGRAGARTAPVPGTCFLPEGRDGSAVARRPPRPWLGLCLGPVAGRGGPLPVRRGTDRSPSSVLPQDDMEGSGGPFWPTTRGAEGLQVLPRGSGQPWGHGCLGQRLPAGPPGGEQGRASPGRRVFLQSQSLSPVALIWGSHRVLT